MIKKRDISGAYNEFVYNNEQGKLTLYANDGSAGSVAIIGNADFRTATGNKPTVVNYKDKNHPDYTVYQDIETGDVFMKINGVYELIYKNDIYRNFFRIPYFKYQYYEDSVYYKENVIVGHDRLMFATYGQSDEQHTPRDEKANMPQDEYDGTVVSPSKLTEILGMEFSNEYDTIVISTTQGVYHMRLFDEDGETNYTIHEEERYTELVHEKRVIIAGLIAHGDGRLVRIYDLDREITDKVLELDFDFSSIAVSNKLLVVCGKDGDIILVDPSTLDEKKRVNIEMKIEYATASDQDIAIRVDSGDVLFLHPETLEITDSSFTQYDKPFAITNKNKLYGAMSDGNIFEFIYRDTRWDLITVDDIFALSEKCLSTYTKELTHINIVDNSEYDYKLIDFEPVAFCFACPGKLFIASDDIRGIVHQYDISDGIFDQKYVGSFQTGKIVTAISYFKEELLVFCGTTCYAYDCDTLELIEIIDMQNILEDYGVISSSVRWDSIYLLTSNGKIYSFFEIRKDPYDIIVLEMYTSKSNIAVIDYNRVYVSYPYSVDTYIYEFSLKDGSLLQKTALDRGLEVDIELYFDSLYVMDLEGRYLLTKYQTREILTLG